MFEAKWDDLVQDDDDERYYFQGTPFSGIAYECFPGGRRQVETSFVDGRQSGVERAWYDNGQMKYERSLLGECVHGGLREWYPTGQLRRAARFEFGVRLESTEWDSDGNETARSVLQPGSVDFDLLQKLRAKWQREIGGRPPGTGSDSTS